MKLIERSVESLLGELASVSPAPGGGSAAALAGAMAASLCCMVCRVTLGKKSLADSWPEMKEALENAELLGARLRRLVDEDADAFTAVVAARKLPQEDAQDAIVHSARVPLETLETLARLAGIVERVARKGNPSCVTDAGSAGAMVRAGALSAAYNVRVNLPDISDESLRRSIAAGALAALAAVEEAAGGVEHALEQSLGKWSTV
ncbi:MAG: cyclodeaminase/cyclohydrolase family protein [Spirochaetia bacterium]